MIAKGPVVEKNNLSAVVQVGLPGNSCGTCESCRSCADTAPGNRLTISVAVDQDVEPGDVIEVDLFLPHQAFVALIMYGMPLLGGMCGGAVGHLLFFGHELALGAGGLAGFAAGFGLVAVLERVVSALRPRAVFRKILKKSSLYNSV
ncbi:MAG: SoxR reducing system RseC family protein [Deltaproteobacteria bacterium]|nr:SoxR reducing system RseC family protein [Deltaproteobacteria bacterium]